MTHGDPQQRGSCGATLVPLEVTGGRTADPQVDTILACPIHGALDSAYFVWPIDERGAWQRGG